MLEHQAWARAADIDDSPARACHERGAYGFTEALEELSVVHRAKRL